MKTNELKPGDTVTLNYGPMHGSADYRVTHVRKSDTGHAIAGLASDDGETNSVSADSREHSAIGWSLKARASK